MPAEPDTTMLARALADAVREATPCWPRPASPAPRVDAELLADHLLGVGLGRLRALMLGDTPAPGRATPNWWPNVPAASRCSTSPAWRTSATLNCTSGPGVFIPRPETESVVQLVIDQVSRHAAQPKVVDLGTGSGAIAGSIAHEVPGAEVHAVEFSEFAHAWASEEPGAAGRHPGAGRPARRAARTQRNLRRRRVQPALHPRRSRPATSPKSPCTIRRGAVRRGSGRHGTADGGGGLRRPAAGARRLLRHGARRSPGRAGSPRMLRALRTLAGGRLRTWTSTARNAPPAPSRKPDGLSDERIGQ